MKVLMVDTNVLIELFRGRTQVAKELNEADKILIPAIVVGELFAGLDDSSRDQTMRAALERLFRLPIVAVHAVTEATVPHFATIRRHLKENGTPIPISNVWIAACAREANATLLSNDTDFDRVPLLVRRAFPPS